MEDPEHKPRKKPNSAIRKEFADGRPYAKSDLAKFYRVSGPTLNNWVKLAGVDIGNKRIFTPAQVAQIVAVIGRPSPYYESG